VRSPLPFPPLAAEALALLLSLIALHPLLAPGYQWGHDTGAHLFRAAEVARAMGEGVVYPRFLPDAYGGLGGPILNFNPVLPYYMPALLILLGVGPIAALKIAAGTAMIAGGVAVAILARPHAGRIGAAVAGLAWVYLPYRIADLYVRMAYSELVAMIFFALALAAARRAARRATPKRIAVLAAAMALILATHFPSCVIGLPAILLYALVSSPPGRRTRGALSFGAALALALALAAFSWLPAITEQAGTHYEDSTSGYDNYGNHFLEWPQLFSTAWGFGQSLPGSRDQMSFQIGWAHLLAVAAAIAAAVRVRRLRRVVAFACGMVAAASFFMLGASRPIWDRLVLLQNVQFPWRLLMLTGIGTSIAAGIAAGQPFLPGSAGPRGGGGARSSIVRLLPAIVLSLLLAAACFPYLKARGGEGSDADFTPEAIRSQYFGELKFQPKEVETMRFRPRGPRAGLLGASGGPLASGSAAIADERTERLIVDVEAPEPATLRLLLFDTPGWRARIDGVEAKVRTEPRTALVLVDVPEGRHRVDLRFGRTPVRTAALVLSILGAVAAAVLLIRPGRVRAAGAAP